MDPQTFQSSLPSAGSFFSRKNIISSLLVGILLLSIPFAVTLVQRRQELRSKAEVTDPIQFVGPNVNCVGNDCSTTSDTIDIQLNSPFGPPAPPRVSVTSAPLPAPTVTKLISCSNDNLFGEAVKISWVNPAQSITRVEINGGQNAACAFKDLAAGTTSTTGPLGFWDECRGLNGGSLYLKPGSGAAVYTYAVHLWNSAGQGPGTEFNIPTCGTPTPSP